MMKTFVLIPAYNPGDIILQIVDDLRKDLSVIVVNDGSSAEHQQVFDTLSNRENVTLLTHAENNGKGAALKTGFQHILDEVPECEFLITADADGQHAVADIKQIAQAGSKNPQALILGVRAVDEMPGRSRFGNSITHWIFKWFYGLNISDTQTGLRGIHRVHLQPFLSIPYERYEYETEMLLLSQRKKIQIVEEPIQTIYIGHNESSHFNAVIDSGKIYFVIFRYVIASLVAAGVDYIIFLLAFPLVNNILYAVFIGRAVSLLVNFAMLRSRVFYSNRGLTGSFLRYLGLVIVSGSLAAWFIQLLVDTFLTPVLWAKLLVETMLFFANFFVNKLFVFSDKDEE